MKYIITPLFLIVMLFGYSQQSIAFRDTSQNNVDSLLKRVNKLEHNQTLIMIGLHDTGDNIKRGSTMLGVGFLASIAGSVLLAVLHPSGNQIINPGQAIGITIGTVGIALSI